jgi:hypothetical protein
MEGFVWLAVIVICLVLGVRALVRKGHKIEEVRKVEEKTGIKATSNLMEDFSRQSRVLSAKWDAEEEIDPAAMAHYEATYNRLRPLLVTHRGTFNALIRKDFRERGDYGETPEVLEMTDKMYRTVTRANLSEWVDKAKQMKAEFERDYGPLETATPESMLERARAREDG